MFRLPVSLIALLVATTTNLAAQQAQPQAVAPPTEVAPRAAAPETEAAPRVAAPQTETAPRPTAPAVVAKPAPAPPRHEWAVSTDAVPSYDAGTLARTTQAIERYVGIVAAGGWPKVPVTLSTETQGPEMALLHKRLAVEGYLPAAAAEGEAFDAGVETALKAFQGNAGLTASGQLNRATLTALNVPADERLRALRATARRLSELNFAFGPRHIVVNIPSAALEAVENGQVVRRYTVIVGNTKHRSPEIAAKVQSINLNPTWTLPVSIIKNEIIPLMRKDPGYLAKQKIRILDGKGGEIDPATIDWSGDKAAAYLFRQDPGVQNSLGAIRINMPNREAVYMHDTPSKRAFSAMDRFLSHGCVRVDGVWDLAAWLLEGSGLPDADRVGLVSRASDGVSQELKLTKSVPVIWVYMTAWAGQDGAVRVRPDVYKYDVFDPDAVSTILKQQEAVR
jgi:murein L,D-transpeptidase YcbB/YkuD